MQEITVTNTGKRVRVRVGHRFEPGKETTVRVTAAGKRAIRATVDLQIVESTAHDDEGQPTPANTVDVSEMTVRQITAALQSGELSKEYVYAQEVNGKARSSVLEAVAPDNDDEDDALVVTKDDEGDDDDGPDTSTGDDDGNNAGEPDTSTPDEG